MPENPFAINTPEAPLGPEGTTNTQATKIAESARNLSKAQLSSLSLGPLNQWHTSLLAALKD